MKPDLPYESLRRGGPDFREFRKAAADYVRDDWAEDLGGDTALANQLILTYGASGRTLDRVQEAMNQDDMLDCRELVQELRRLRPLMGRVERRMRVVHGHVYRDGIFDKEHREERTYDPFPPSSGYQGRAPLDVRSAAGEPLRGLFSLCRQFLEKVDPIWPDLEQAPSASKRRGFVWHAFVDKLAEWATRDLDLARVLTGRTVYLLAVRCGFESPPRNPATFRAESDKFGKRLSLSLGRARRSRKKQRRSRVVELRKNSATG